MSNHLAITGRLGQDPELRFLESGRALANFTLANTPRRYNPDTKQWEDHGETLWLRCTVFGKQAEWFAEHAHKGTQATVQGSLVARSWDKDGQKRTEIECRVEQVGIQTTSAQGYVPPGQRPQQPAADPWATGGNQSQGGFADEPPF